MAWKRERTTTYCGFDMDLDEFSEEQLLQGLIDAKWLSEEEAEAIKQRARSKGESNVGFLKDMPPDDFEIARLEARRGRRSEALIYLSRALGRDFDQILTQ